MSTSYASRGFSHRLLRWLPWLSALVLVAGAIAALIAFAGNTAHPNNPVVSAKPAVVPKTPRTVPLAPAARKVADEFILTAVTRANLPRAWALSGPDLRRGVTYKEWLTGDIPVVPYPAAPQADMKIDYSFANRALLEFLLVPKKGVKAKPGLFFLKLKLYGTGNNRHWLVSYWAPRAAPPIPLNTSR